MTFARLSRLDGETWIPHEHPRTYTLEESRVIAGMPRGAVDVFRDLVACVAPPYYVLYVLHTPRGEGEPGRYQSEPVGAAELDAFLERFGAFLAGDGRFDLWCHSPADRATIVWDRHDRLFAYGPLPAYVAALLRHGFDEGAVEIPAPHQHHYHPELDALANELVASRAWTISPLQPDDEQ